MRQGVVVLQQDLCLQPNHDCDMLEYHQRILSMLFLFYNSSSSSIYELTVISHNTKYFA